MTALLDLIQKIKGATGPDRELDAAIAVAITPTRSTDDDLIYAKARDPGNDATHPGHYFLQSRSGASCQTAPHYTSSIDSALTLVPEGSSVHLHILHGSAQAEVGIGNVGIDSPPALALCIAALQARQKMKEAVV